MVLNIAEYSWICLVEYGRICVNIPKSVWTAFVLYFPIVFPRFLERVVTYFYVYTKLEVLVSEKMRLFSWRQNLIFSIVMLVFCLVFALDWILLQVRFQIYSHLWGPRGLGNVNLDIPYFSLLFLQLLYSNIV